MFHDHSFSDREASSFIAAAWKPAVVIYVVNGYLNSEFLSQNVEIGPNQQLVLYRGSINNSAFEAFDKIGLGKFIYRHHYVGIV